MKYHTKVPIFTKIKTVVTKKTQIGLINNIKKKILGGKSTLENTEDIEDERSDEETECLDEMPKTVIVSSVEEDNVIHKFHKWLQTTDGGKKLKYQADKHRNLVMQAVCHNPDIAIDYRNLVNIKFLNSWVEKLKEEGKLLGTIKTYLGSIAWFYRFCIIDEDVNLLDVKVVNRMKETIMSWSKVLWKGIQIKKT